MSINKSKIVLIIYKNLAAYGLFIAILAVSTAAIFIRKAQANISSLVIATYRLCLASIMLLPFSIKRVLHEKKALHKKNIFLLVLSGILLALHFASWITSLEFTNVASSVVLVTTTPIWVAILSPLILKERQSSAFSIGLAVAVVGIIITSVSGICRLSSGGIQCAQTDIWGADKALLGNFLALAGAWCAAGYMMVGRRVRKELSNRSYIFLVYSVSAITLLLISLLTRQPLLSVSGIDMLWLVALALIPQVVGHSLLNWALGRLPAAYVSLSLLGEPVGSTLLAYLLLSESPSALELIGGAVIIFGIYWATKPARRAEQTDATI